MDERETVLIVDDEQDLLEGCARILEGESFNCVTTASSLEVLDLVERHKPSAIVTDFLMPGKDGMAILKEVNRSYPHLPVIMVSAYATIGGVVEAVKIGAFDYITKPFSADQLVIAVKRAVEKYRLLNENAGLKQKLQSDFFNHYFVGKHPKFIAIEEQIKRVAVTDSNVLLQGETGTGKELAARAIHLNSKRANGPFVVVDCATLSSEMERIVPYGGGDMKAPYEKSAFEAANGGTIFIEQVDDLDLAMQARLLRILQDRKVQDNAEWQAKQLDLRVITSTTINLHEAVADKTFRENLYYCLNVINIHIPPLRERKEDIGILCDHFLRQRSEKNGIPLQVLHHEALARLMGYDWPGNVRELRNVVERAASATEERTITINHLPVEIIGTGQMENYPFKEARRRFLEQFEKRYLENLIVKYNGNISRASENAGLTRMSFYRILKRIGLLKEGDNPRAFTEAQVKRREQPGKKPQ